MNRDQKVIMWTRQWAEDVEDEDILKWWKEGKELVRDWGQKEFHFNLRRKEVE